MDIQSVAFSQLRRSRILLTRVFHLFLPSQQVDWQQGNALQPESFAHLFPQVDGVVHTLGTLIEDTDYKRAVKEGDFPGLFGAVFQGLRSGGGNPLQKRVAPSENSKSYEWINRDSGELQTRILFFLLAFSLAFSLDPSPLCCVVRSSIDLTPMALHFP